MLALRHRWDRLRAADHPVAYARGVVANMARNRTRRAIRERSRIRLLWAGRTERADEPDVGAGLDVRAALAQLPFRKRAYRRRPDPAVPQAQAGFVAPGHARRARRRRRAGTRRPRRRGRGSATSPQHPVPIVVTPPSQSAGAAPQPRTSAAKPSATSGTSPSRHPVTPTSDGPISARAAVDAHSTVYWSQNNLTVEVGQPLTALTVELRIAQTGGPLH